MMTAPRQILSNSSYLLTRRCSERRFFLKPTRGTTRLLKFCLAVAAARSGVVIHAFLAMSNHYHLVVTDPDGNLPEFMRYFNEFVARALNCRFGRFESFWAPGSYSEVRLEEAADVLDAMIYTLANPVAAGLVKRCRDWRGATSVDLQPGEVENVERPDFFFRKNGPVPEGAELEVETPPGFEHLSATEFRSLLVERLAQREAEVGIEMISRGQRIVGMRQVLRRRHTDRPDTWEPRRGLNPRIAAKNRHTRIAALARLREFRDTYRQCWTEWRSGDRRVVFPAGTYALHRQSGVSCRPPPDS